mgnify:CR=1 FL=1
MLEETQHRTIAEQEAINRLSFIRGALLVGTKPEIIPSEKNIKLMDTAIEALETIAEIRNRKITLSDLENYMKFEDECVKKNFTLKSLLEAREKQIAKKPTPIDYEKYINITANAKFLRGAFWCPCCKHVINSGAFCQDCGQKIDWSEEDE